MKSHFLHIYGKNPVNELFADHPKLIHHIYLKETVDQATFDHIRKEARIHNTGVSKVPEKKLDSMVGDVAHQGVVAEIKEFPYADFHQWLHDLDVTDNPVVFLLNEITDPHNVGAIIRSAAAFGVAAVLLPKNRQVGINGTVYKSSAGTAHKIPIMQIGNTNQTLELLKEKGFWTAGLDADGEKSLYDETFDTPMIIVIGGEGRGVREKTKDHCDYLISIPMREGIESLNASVAAAMVAYEANRKRG